MKRDNPKRDLSNRILEIDILRGISVLLMVFDHTIFDLWGLLPGLFTDYPQELLNFGYDYWNWGVRIVVRYVIVFFFLALTGICCSFSRSNLKRGVKLMVVALALTLATYILAVITRIRDMTIVFGILHSIALSLIIIGVLELFKTNKWIYLAVGVAMVVLGIIAGAHSVVYRFGDIGTAELVLKTIIGTARCGGDSAGLLLTGGQIFIGVFLGRFLYSDKKSLFGAQYSNNFVTFFGRHSLFVYIASQVIMPVLVALVLLCCGYHLAL